MIAWGRDGQDAAELLDAIEQKAVPVPEVPKGLDRRVGYVNMRWVWVVIAWFVIEVIFRVMN